MAVSRYYSSAARRTTLTADVNGSSTSMQVAAATGWPSLYPYTLIIDQDTVSEEIVTVTNRSGQSLTVIRGADGTSGTDHTAGAVVEHGVSARDFTESRQHEDATENVHGTGLGSAVVGTSTTQTLTNKTLTSPAITGGTMTGGTITSATLVSPVFTADIVVPASAGIEFEGATADAFETRLIAADPTADRTITLPNATTTVVGTDVSQTLTNKTLTSPTISGGTVSGTLTNSGTISGGTVNVTTLQQNSINAATVSSTQTLTNKTISGANNTIQNVPQTAVTNLVSDLAAKESVANVTAHVNATAAHGATGAVVGTTNTQTLTNKTLTNPTVNGATLTGTLASTANLSGGTVSSATLSSGTLGTDLNAGSFKVTSLAAPSASTDAATKGYVDTSISNLIDSSPGTLDTLNELAAALGDDPNFATTVTNSIATKVAKAGDTMTGTLTFSSGAKVTGLADPTVTSDAVNLGYMNTLFGSTASAAASALAAQGYANDADDSADAAALSASQALASLGYMPIDGGAADSVYGGVLLTIDGGVA